jgi:trimeric autotransporter adhesin
MDAVNLSFKRISLSIALALLMAAAVHAQPAFIPTLTTISLSGSEPLTEMVSSATSTQINFNARASYTSGDPQWLCLNQGQASSSSGLSNLTTPTTFNVSVGCNGTNLGIFTGTHTAIITLGPTATDTSSAASIFIPVTYTVGSGGASGTGPVTASPPSISKTISFGSQVGVQVTLSTLSTSPVGFTVGGIPGWMALYQSSGISGFVSSAQSATLQITLNGSGQNEASLSTTLTVNAATGTVTIPITLNNGVAASGGSGGTGSLSVYPSTLSWLYSAFSPGTFPSQTTLTISSTNGQIGYNATATSSNGWLLINNLFVASGTLGVTPLTISPSTNLASLAPGTYTGSVAISGSDGSAVTVTITATVSGISSSSMTISPSPIPLAAAVNGSTTQATVSITSAVSGTLSATATGSGVTVSGTGQNVTAGVTTNITVSGNPTGLTNGTYLSTLNVSVAGNSAGAQINFVVGTGSPSGNGTTAAPTPAQLNFYYEPNTNTQTSQTQQVYLSGSGNFTIASSTANTSSDWLAASPTSRTLPSLIYVTASPSGLASSTYNGQITINNTSTGQISTVNVSLLVNGVTTIYASPGDWVFNYIPNVSSLSQVQAITIATSDGSTVPITASVSNAGNTPWLTVSGSGNTPTGITVTANAGNLSNGVYSGSIVINGGNNSLSVPIVLTVVDSSISSETGPLTLSESVLSLQALVNGAPVSQTLSVSASTPTTFTVASQGSYNGISWLSVSPFGTTTAPITLTITAYPAGLAAGNYSGTISLVSNGVTQTIQVSLIVGGAISSGTSVVVTADGAPSTSPTLTFTASSMSATVASQYLTITSAAGQSSVPFTASTSTTSGVNWIQLNVTAGMQYYTPFSALIVTVNTGGLTAGTYNGSIAISPSGGAPVTVPLTLTIAGAAPAIDVSTTSLSFSYQVGGATPGTQTVPISVSNAITGSFTATAASTPSGWLVISPNSGIAPGNLTVSVSPTGLSGGTYSGTVTVAGSSGTAGNGTVNVSLTVTAPLLPTVTMPTIATVVNAASFVNEPISPGEIITIGGTNIGPLIPQSFTLTSIGGIQTVPSAALGGVQVTVNGYPAPLLYVSATQINAIVPYEVAGIPIPSVLVYFLGQSSNGYSLSGAATAPGIFTVTGLGSGPGAILNADYSSNVTSATARGGVVQVFMTGEGQTSPAGVDGKVTIGPYPVSLLPVAITVAGQPASYEFAGEAPGLVSGVLQLDVIIPSTLTVTGNVPLTVSIGSTSTQGGVTVNIK